MVYQSWTVFDATPLRCVADYERNSSSNIDIRSTSLCSPPTNIASRMRPSC